MRIFIYIFIITNLIINPMNAKSKIEPSNYKDLVDLFKMWRDFENPPLMNGAPDYTQRRFTAAADEFNSLQSK